MKKIFDELEKIIFDNLNDKNINDLIHDNEYLFYLYNISDDKEIFKIFKKVKILYQETLKWYEKNITNITKIKKNMKKEISENFYCSDNTNIHSDLFLEVESIIAYFQISFKPKKELLFQFEKQYHFLKMLFLYLYSSFDISACLVISEIEDKNVFDDKEMRKIKFQNFETYISKECKIENNYLINELIKISKSNSFRYIKLIRNKLSHRPECPFLKFHFSTNIMIVFIILTRMLNLINEYL